jgi:hypothetical protein
VSSQEIVPERKLENFLKFKEKDNSIRRNPDPIEISRTCPPQAHKNSSLTQKFGKLAVFVQALDPDKTMEGLIVASSRRHKIWKV